MSGGRSRVARANQNACHAVKERERERERERKQPAKPRADLEIASKRVPVSSLTPKERVVYSYVFEKYEYSIIRDFFFAQSFLFTNFRVLRH